MTEVKSKASLLTEASLILAAVFWGTNYAATKFAAQSIPPDSIVATARLTTSRANNRGVLELEYYTGRDRRM